MESHTINRHKTRQIMVGDVPVGGDAPISVQSMTNTKPDDVAGTIAQVKALEEAGADIVRISCPTEESTVALAEVIKGTRAPIVADIHFHYKRAIEAAQAGAACLRINPGNIGSASRVKEVIQAARDYNCSMRIGVNGGSLEAHLLDKYKEPNSDALVESALAHAAILQEADFHEFKISVKASDVWMAVQAYRKLAQKIDCPLHIGITESGTLRGGLVKSSIGLGMLLAEGIGDTMRVSLAADPVEEVVAGWNMLKALGLRSRGVTIVACPSCARQGFDVIKTVQALEEKLAHIRQPMTVSILGCIVNGVGEAKHSDIGIAGGGKGMHQLYVGGEAARRLGTDDMIKHITALVEEKAQQLEGQN